MKRIPPGARKAIRYTLTGIILVAVGILFYKALAENWNEVVKHHLGFSWWDVGAVLIFAVAVPVSGLLWGQIVNRLSPDHRVGPREAMAVHSSSWLLKYIPGQIGSVMNKVLWGQNHGFTRTLMLITFIYENVFLQLASIVPSVIILLATVGAAVFANNVGTVLLPLIALIPLIAVLDRRIFHRVLSFASKRVLKQKLPEEYFLPTRASLLYLVEYITPRILNGIGFVWIGLSFTDVPPNQWLLFGASYALAGAIGILAVFVPSGLGVREAVIAACLLAGGIPPAEAVIMSLLSRLLSTVADGVIALIYGALRLSLRRNPGREIVEPTTKS